MLFNSLINESVESFNTNTVEPIYAPHLTPDATGMGLIMQESTEYDILVESSIVDADYQMLKKKMEGNLSESTLVELQENVIKDVFSKMINGIKSLWAKVIGWIKNLIKSIQVQFAQSDKAFKNIEKFIDKDLSEMSYDVHDWKDGKAYESLSSNSASYCSSVLSTVEKSVVNSAPSDVKETMKKNATDEELMMKKLFGKEMSLQEAKEFIKESYGCDGSKITKDGLSKSDAASMIAFCKSFPKSKTISSLETKTNKLYSSAVSSLEKAKNVVEKNTKATASKMDNPSDKRTEVQSYGGDIASVFKLGISFTNRLLGCYNTLMAECTNCERMRFNEYKSILASAVRSKGKKED